MKPISMYGSSSASEPPMRWMSFGRLALGDVEHVVDRHDADEHAGRVGDRQRRCGRTAGTRATADC